MVNIKLYRDIDNEYFNYGEQDMVFSLESLQNILAQAPDDNDITIHIHSDGGSVHEGLAIYDYLRTSGKNIYTHIDGNCHSMAVIILLAAPQTQRTANPNARALIHKVRTQVYGTLSADDMQAMEAETRKLQDTILGIYENRTGTPRDVLQAVMDKEEYQDTESLQALGFISRVVDYNTNKDFGHRTQNAEHRTQDTGRGTQDTGHRTQDTERGGDDVRRSSENFRRADGTSLQSRNNGNNALTFITKNMEKKMTVRDFLNKVGQFLNASDAKNYEHTDVDGNVLFTTEAEDATLTLGMPASPDGEYEVPEVGKVVIAGGVITQVGDQIAEPDNADPTEEEIAEMHAEIEALKAENEELKKQLEETKKQLEEATALLTEAKNYLKSNYKPATRSTNARVKQGATYDMNVVRERRAAMLK